MLRFVQLLLLFVSVGGGDIIDPTSMSLSAYCGFFFATNLTTLTSIYKWSYKRISSSPWFTPVKVTQYNLTASYLYSAFLDTFISFISSTFHLALYALALIQMEGSIFHAGTFLAIIIGLKYHNFGACLPQIINHRHSHVAPTNPVSHPYADSLQPKVQLPVTALSRRSYRRHVKKLLNTADSAVPRRRYRRYHRHYHRRVKFLHTRRKPCPKLPTEYVRPNIFRRAVTSIKYHLNFKAFPVDHVFDLPRDRSFSSIGEIPDSSPDLEPPVHPVLLDIFLAPHCPHIYDDDWGWNGSSPPKRLLFFHPDVITQFCKNMDPIKLHRTLDMFSESNWTPPSHPTPHTIFNESSKLQQGIALFEKVASLSHRVRNAIPLHQSFGFYTNCAVPLGESSFIVQPNLNHLPIVIDTGASRSLSPRREDFIEGSFTPLSKSLEGISEKTSIEGKGLVNWKVTDMYGKVGFIVTEAYYVPSATIRLYSPQFHFREHSKGKISMGHDIITLTLPPMEQNKNKHLELSFPFQQSSNLPLMLKSDHPDLPDSFNVANSLNSRYGPIEETLETTISSGDFSAFLADIENPNLSPAQKELLVWHWKLGHVNMPRIQRLMHPAKPLDSFESRMNLSPPVVFATNRAKTHRCEVPKCQACLYAKMGKRSAGATRVEPRAEKVMALSRDKMCPGDAISMDQFICSDKGRSSLRSSGKERDEMMFSGGTIFSDHFSNKIWVFNQVSLRAGETLLGKRQLEREAASNGVKIKEYHSDNGVFVSDQFRADILRKEQMLKLSGVGSQHQNGKAERSIRTVFSLARAMMIHSALYWPDSHDLSHWPLAVNHAVWILNNLPGDDGLSAEEKFSGQKSSSYDHLRRTHVWGAPCYVLDPALQNGSKLPKFKARSRQGKFLGYSLEHASSVGLILNRQTGRISPQFHVVYDDYFQTVRGLADSQELDLDAIDWDAFINLNNTENLVEPDDLVEHNGPLLDPDWQVPFASAITPDVNVPIPVAEGVSRRSAPLPSRVPPLVKGDSSPPVRAPPAPIIIDDDDHDQTIKSSNVSTPTAPSEGDKVDRDASVGASSLDAARAAAKNGVRRSKRIANLAPQNYNEDFLAENRSHGFFTTAHADYNAKRKFTRGDLDSFELGNLDWKDSLALLASSPEVVNGDSRRFLAAMDVLEDPFGFGLDEFPTFGLVNRLSASSADNPRYHEAMSGPNADGFLNASVVEISTLQHMDAWKQVERLPSMNVLPSTWAFKIKRFPDGLIRKLKARFCVRGDRQIEGVDYFDTFAPVVQWSTVRLLLVLSLSLGLATKQVDYVSAFCQAPIEEDVYIEHPRGWRKLNGLGLKEKFKEGHVLKLNRSVYGLKQSPKNFFKLLKTNLENCGLTQSRLDPCLFIGPKVICVCYVDDCLFFAPDDKDIDDCIEAIKNCGMDLQVEDSVAGFLGVHIDRDMTTDENGNNVEEITLLQTGLIDRIINDLGLTKSTNGVKTPAICDPLPKDSEGEPFDADFNYASIVGMCLYLCNNSRPDITFAVNQCSRYNHFPKRIHAEALKRIGRYLISTRDKGLILRTSNSLHIDCYVDADFAGLYSHENIDDPASVRSRTGYVINVGGCPIIWKSTLQKEIACSTMESEYIACSTSCRELIPLRSLVKEISSAVGIPDEKIASLHTTIWEDNVGALTLANLELPRMTPRSKHIAIKYHWFRSHLGRLFQVVKVGTLDQLGDMFTKGLGPVLFEQHRKRLMGW